MAKGRVRVVAALTSWEDVDDRLKEIASLQAEVEAEEAELTERIARLKDEYIGRVKRKKEEIERKTLEIRAFAEAHRGDFDGKSKKLNHGVVGWRKSTKLIIRRVADTLARLKDLGLEEYIRIKESVDKAALKEAPCRA